MDTVRHDLDTPEMAALYDEIGQHQCEVGMQMIGDRIQEGWKVLDVGCGTGMLLLKIVEKVGPTGLAIGVEPTEEHYSKALEKVGKIPNAQVEKRGAEDLSPYAGAIDLIVMNFVWHWVEENLHAHVARQLFDSLKPGCWLLLSTGDGDCDYAPQDFKVEVLSQEPYRNDPGAGKGLAKMKSKKYMEDLFSGTGFVEVKATSDPIKWRNREASKAVLFSEVSSFGNYLGHITDPKLAAGAREAITSLFEERCRTGDGFIEYEATRLFLCARKPSSPI